MDGVLEKQVLFDGGECPKKWVEYGGAPGQIPDEFVESCRMGAANLHVFRMGWYRECFSCGYKIGCQERACNTGEQGEGC